jgi:mannose-6-phosphate isomerase-like protein (cupin superfamily)
MEAAVRRLDPATEVSTSENCHIVEVSNSGADPDLSIARARVAPGVTTRWHRLDGIAERYVILSGQGRVEVGGLPPTMVQSGDVVLIPPMCRQRITNIDEVDLIFFAVCTPRFTAAAYEDIEAESAKF